MWPDPSAKSPSVCILAGVSVDEWHLRNMALSCLSFSFLTYFRTQMISNLLAILARTWVSRWPHIPGLGQRPPRTQDAAPSAPSFHSSDGNDVRCLCTLRDVGRRVKSVPGTYRCAPCSGRVATGITLREDTSSHHRDQRPLRGVWGPEPQH